VETFAPAEYLAMETVAEYKSEYYNGEIFALAGGTPDHSKVALNFGAELLRLLEPRPCHVFNSDMRLFVEQSGLYTYPDVVVESERPHVEGYRRTEDDQWLIEMYVDLDAPMRLASVAAEIPLRRIYHKVSWLS
jgi:Uma2 family endonuclease